VACKLQCIGVYVTESFYWPRILNQISLFVLILVIQFNQVVYASENNYFHLPTYSQRLTNLWITAILEDEQGYLWIGTEQGLNRLDPQQNIAIKDAIAVNLGLEDTYIWDLANLDQHRILVATTTGLYFFDYRTNQFSRFGTEQLFPQFQGGGVFALTQTKAGQTWILALNGLYLLDKRGEKLQDFTHLLNQIPNSKDNDFIALAATNDQQLYIATRKQVHALHVQQNSIEIVLDTTYLHPSIGKLTSLTLDEQQHLWVGGREGAVLIAPQDERLILQNISGHYISQMLIDEYNIMWIATHQGLLKFNRKTNEMASFQAYNQAAYQIQKRRLSRVKKDHNGAIWVGTQGAGLNVYLPPASQVELINHNSSYPFALINNDVWAIHEDNNGYIVATNAGVQFYDKHRNTSVVLNLLKSDSTAPLDEIIYTIKPLQNNYLLGGEDGLFLVEYPSLTITRLAQPMAGFPPIDSRVLDVEIVKNQLYIATDNGVYLVSMEHEQHAWLGKEQGLRNTYVKDIEVDAQGNLWLGTPQGVSVLPATSDQFYHYLQAKDDELFVNEVSKLLLLEPGLMLVSFYNKGLFAIDYRNGFEHAKVLDLNIKYGISYKNIFTLARVDQQFLLLGTDQGLYRVDTQNNIAEMYNKSDGLPSAEFNEGAAFCVTQWGCSLGSSAGVLKIKPEQLRHRIDKNNVRASELKIHYSEQLSDWLLRPPTSVSLAPTHSGLSVKFTSLNYLDSQVTKFKYRLLPNQQTFIELGSGELFLSKLQPGKYQLEVMGTLNNVWQQQRFILPINAQPFWWQTLAARLTLMTISALILIFVIQNRMNYIRRIKRYNHELFLREQTIQLALWGSDAGTWHWTRADNVVILTQLADDGKHMRDVQFDEKRWLSAITPEIRTKVQQRWQAYISKPKGSYKDEYTIRLNGQLRWFVVSGKAVEMDKQGQAEKIVGTFQDSSEQKSLEEERLLFGQAFESSNEGIIILDEVFNNRGVNPSAERITGFTKQELMQGSVNKLFADNSIPHYQEILALVNTHGNWQGESKIKTKQNKDCPVWMNITKMLRSHDINYYLILFADISESKNADRALRQLTNYDVLTGLANRKLFEQHLAFAIEHGKANIHRLALLFIDLVRFKAINDRYGHNVGDIVLHKVAQRMQSVLAKDDIVARFGGDKFVILLGTSATRDVDQRCHALLATFEQNILLNDMQFHIGITIGISLWPDDDESGDQLIKHAEMAMYQAKAAGRNHFQYFSAGLQQKELEKLKIEQELLYALEKQQFSLYYQPQIDARTNDIIGVEALIRWIHPVNGFISPEVFIPIAEANGLIIPISNWVLETAVKTAIQWHQKLSFTIKMAVNISGLHFNEPNFAQGIIAVLTKYQLPPDSLCLEITEGMLISDVEQPLAALKQLRNLGVQVAIDDFGTGYSSLAYLKHFPVTSLKIDKSFVLNLARDINDQAIVNSVISLGHFLGFSVIAEGVEQLVDYQMLQQMNCDQVQGYYFAKPLPEPQALAFIEQHRLEQLQNTLAKPTN
jgi:diguanylate cyclase (GGDEF)-like protein/PAS domain S-box-containing protein